MVCLDTSAIVDFLKGNESMLRVVGEYKARNEIIATTVITVHELLKNPDAKRRMESEAFLSELLIYGMNETAAKMSAEMYRTLKSKGKMINEPDIFITNIAAVYGEVLLASDKDFEATGYARLQLVKK